VFVNVRRMVAMGLAALGVVLGRGLFVFSASALAVAPETPELTVEAPVHATSAVFHGVLNPKEALVPNNMGGTYKFPYRASPMECTGTGAS
jgi:hypothetical protein